jgi:hypothetical protein
MTPIEPSMYFGLAAGIEDPDELTKTASAYLVDQERLICRLLEQRDYLPDFEKIALMPPPEAIQEMMAQQMGSEGGAPAEGDPAAGAEGRSAGSTSCCSSGCRTAGADAGRAAPATASGIPALADRPGAGRPLARWVTWKNSCKASRKPSVSRPRRTAGLPPTGAEEPPPPAPQPEERIQQVAPGMDPETTQRYAQKLTEFEQDMGMAISDPKQMVKFVQSLQKVDGKYIDEGIKQMTQKWEQEMGIGQTVQGASPTVPGFGGGAGGAAGGAGAGAGGGAGGAGGKPEVQPGQPLPAAQAAGTKPKQPQPQQPGAGAEATKKIAHAAEALARIASAG